MYISRGAEPRNKLYYCDLSLLEGGKIAGEYSVTFEVVCVDLYCLNYRDSPHAKVD